MAPLNVEADAKRVYDVLKAGGTAVVPMSVGYAICSSNPTALERIFSTKQRGAHKRHGMGGSYELHKQVHIMDPVHAEIVHTLVKTLGLPMGVVAKYDRDNPVIKNIDAITLQEATNGDNMAMLIGAGDLQDEIIKLTSAEAMPVLGSSANISGTGPSTIKHEVVNGFANTILTGTKYRVEDIQPEILEVADLVVDYGLVKWWVHGRASTMLDFSGPTIEVVRIGACYETIKDALKRFWNIDLPSDPGHTSLPSGHLKNLQPLESLQRLMAKA